MSKASLVFETDGDYYSVPLDKLGVILAQLRHVPPAEGSAEATVKDQDNVLFALKAGEPYYFALAVGHLEVGGGGLFGFHSAPQYR